MAKIRSGSVIRNATKRDLAAVQKWLRAEYELKGEGFFCNWSIIDRAFKRKDLFVLDVVGDVLGFVVDGTRGPDIVEVCPEKRGMGYGRYLAEWAINSAFKRGNSVFEGECAPASSVPFWEKLGLTVVRSRTGPGGGLYAYKILERKIGLGAGPRVPYEIAFYPPERDWKKDTEPFRTCAGEAQRLNDGSLQLPERAFCFDPQSESHDYVVRIAVNGADVYEDKVRRPKAESFGVCSDPGGIYFLERIVISAS
jgi:GNAT superfamily N-acetyltransferase